MKLSRKTQFVIRLGLLVTFAAAGVWAASKVDWRLVAEHLRAADIGWMLCMTGAWIVSLCIRPFRMMVLAQSLTPTATVRYLPVLAANIAALAVNSILPMRAGDVMMIFLLGRSLGVSAPASASIVLADRFFEFATVIAIFATTLLLVPVAVPWAHGAIAVLIPAVLALSGGFWLAIHMRRIWLNVLDRLFAKFSSQRANRWRAPLHDMFEGFARLDSLRKVGLVVALSTCQWLLVASSWWFGIAGVWPSASLAAAAFAASAIALSSIVPIVPASVGVFHGTAVLALSVFGMPVESALAFAIVSHAMQVGSVLVLGVVALAWQGVGFGSIAAIRRGD